MASTQEFVIYVCGQMEDAGAIFYRKMFGEYGIYYNNKLIGVICENHLYIKTTEKGRNCLTNIIEEPPYSGAKPHFRIDDLKNKSLLADLLKATWEELPEPKPKKTKATKKPQAISSKLF